MNEKLLEQRAEEIIKNVELGNLIPNINGMQPTREQIKEMLVHFATEETKEAREIIREFIEMAYTYDLRHNDLDLCKRAEQFLGDEK